MVKFILKNLPLINYLLMFVLINGCAAKSDDSKVEKKAPLFNNLGSHVHEITTYSDLAQKYFNQGLILSYGFNHAEAKRSFTEAARYDSNCAMAYWGIALVLGSNINVPMNNANIPEAYYAVQKAISLSENVSEKEKDYIMALSERYSKDSLADRSSLDIAYADAMRKLAKKYPDDLDAVTLFAESLLDLHPWDFWEKNGTAKPWTKEIVTILENILAKDPNHPGANHFYIHAVEASKNPEKALNSANKLINLVPGAGHLVHMPSHIYLRVGDYNKGIYANEKATAADESYIDQCHAQGVYPLAYVPHNHHFLWTCATLDGRRNLAIESVKDLLMHTDQEKMHHKPFGRLQQYYSVIYISYVRFGMWDEILKEEEPDLPFLKSFWHYARCYAYIGKNQLSKAEQELGKLKTVMKDKAIKEIRLRDVRNTTEELLDIASEILKGEIEAKRKNYSSSIAHLTKALEIEDQLYYREPPDWFFPVRHSLGAVYLDAGMLKEAEKVYREDLENFPENGWSLFGLEKSLRAQGKNKEADEIQKQFVEAWSEADIKISSSRIL
ncbi:MAG: tetratricopeptide repeat protein [Ignavibacteria bacterium]